MIKTLILFDQVHFTFEHSAQNTCLQNLLEPLEQNIAWVEGTIQ